MTLRDADAGEGPLGAARWAGAGRKKAKASADGNPRRMLEDVPRSERHVAVLLESPPGAAPARGAGRRRLSWARSRPAGRQAPDRLWPLLLRRTRAGHHHATLGTRARGRDL